MFSSMKKETIKKTKKASLNDDFIMGTWCKIMDMIYGNFVEKNIPQNFYKQINCAICANLCQLQLIVASSYKYEDARKA